MTGASCHNYRRKGLALISFALALTVLVPLLGLGIDTAMLYVVKERLNSAVQLSLRSTQRSQDDPQKAAQRYFDANFPQGFLGSGAREVSFKDGQLHATIEAPTFFMKMFRRNSVKVEASASL